MPPLNLNKRKERNNWSASSIDSALSMPRVTSPARAMLQKRDRSEHGSARPSPSCSPMSSPLPSPVIQPTRNPFNNPALANGIHGFESTKSSNFPQPRSPLPSPGLHHTHSPFDDLQPSHNPPSPDGTTLHNSSFYEDGHDTPKLKSNDNFPMSTASLAQENRLLTSPESEQYSRSRIIRALVACKNKIYRHLDPKTIWGIIDIREIFWPFTWKKYAVLLVVAGLIAAICTTELMFRWIEKSMTITRRNMLPVLVLVIGLEPLMMVLILLIAKIPRLTPNDASPSNPAPQADLAAQMSALEKQVSIEQNPHSTALVIPCHNSDHVAMKRVLESAYPHFRPQDIFIIDNGRSLHPNDSTFREFIRSQNAEINYIWSPIGSKTAAQLVGAMAAKNHEFIMTVDDDVCIPANFRAPTDLIDDKTKGVAFPLKATDANGKRPLFLVSWQDCEYRMAGLAKLAESRVCGVLFPHGAGWFCDRETLIELITNYHSIDFIADDVNTGLAMQKMKKMIAFDARCILETEVPTTFLGEGLNWYNQRVRSWEMGRHGRLLAFANCLLFSFNGQTTPWGIFAQKFTHVYSIACIVVDWVRVPVLVTMGTNAAYWRQAGPLTFASVLPLIYYKYISCRHRPDLQPGFWGSLTYPIYKQIYSLVSIIGAVRSVVFYIGGHKRPMTIRQMVKERDPQAFWLDPRFESNPAFLADDGEAKRAKHVAEKQEVAQSKKEFRETIIEMPSPTLGGPTLRPSLYSSPAMSWMSLDCISPAQPRAF